MLEVIEKRRSVRKYKDEAVPEEVIREILTAGMHAPSAKNSRPWEFFVVSDKESIEKIAGMSPYTNFLPSAPVCIVVCCRAVLPKRLEGVVYWPQDLGACIENMLLQATELGYGTCWCGFYPEPRSAVLQEFLGTDSVPMSVIALGLPDEEPVMRGFYDEERVHFLS